MSERPDPVKGSAERKQEHALKVLDVDDVERLLAEAEMEEEEDDDDRRD